MKEILLKNPLTIEDYEMLNFIYPGGNGSYYVSPDQKKVCCPAPGNISKAIRLDEWIKKLLSREGTVVTDF